LGTYKLPASPFTFSKKGLWALFLMAAFPTHIWTILLVFQDFAWVAERTNAWDAVGVGAYGLLVAFIESLFVFAAALILSTLVSARWGEEKRLALMTVLIFITGIWAIANQLFFMLGLSVPEDIIAYLAARAHPLRMIYAGLLVIVSASVAAPTALLLAWEKAAQVAHQAIDRLAVLTTLYLVLDAGGLAIVILRNL
jgi:hypothetical protein